MNSLGQDLLQSFYSQVYAQQKYMHMPTNVMYRNIYGSPFSNSHRLETAMMISNVEWIDEVWYIHRVKHCTQ